jgi:SAM-dependent methyltransferase
MRSIYRRMIGAMEAPSASRTFDTVASLYDRARPRYPEQLFVDLIAQADLPERARALEIGAGTGQATAPLARRGFEILCLEPGENLARVAANNLQQYPGTRVVTQTFEQAELPAGHYHLVFAAQSFHWVPRAVALSRTAAVLAPRGVFAAFWNYPVNAENETRTRIDEAYRRHAPSMKRLGPRSDPGYGFHDIEAALLESADLGGVWKCGYLWQQSYSTASYLDLMRTHSDHLLMSDADREDLLQAIARAIDEAGGTYEVEYETKLFGAHRTSQS